MKTLSLFILLLFPTILTAQPYIDIINARYLYNFKNNGEGFNHYNLSTTLPIVFKKSKDAFILSPYYEHWDISIGNRDYNLNGLVLPVSFFKNLTKQWSLLATVIVRSNYEESSKENSKQYGGAIIASLKQSAKKTYKFGMYYNREFFGSFIMPLLGLDFNLSDKDNLFGVLPGNLTFEHKVNKSFYYGGTFRAITNSYLLFQVDPGFSPDFKDFLRIDDNQLAMFADLYLTNNILLNAEMGHSVLRKIRRGFERHNKTTYSNTAFNSDQFFAKLSLGYRIRLKR